MINLSLPFFLRFIALLLLLSWSGKTSAQILPTLTISGPSTCVAPLVGNTYTGTMSYNSGGCTMFLWTIEPTDAGTFVSPGGINSGLSCVFVSEAGCGIPPQMPLYEGDGLGCGNSEVRPYGFTSHSVTVRWVKNGTLKLKLKEQGDGPFFEVSTQMSVNVLPKNPTAINVTSSSKNHVSMNATFQPGSNCPNLRFRWRVSTCGGPFGAPIETATPTFTLNNNFCNCSAIVKVSSVVGTGANEKESTQLQRSFPRIEVPDLLGPDYLCKGSTTDFYLSGLPSNTNWYVESPAYVEYSDAVSAGIYLPEGNYTYGFNLGVSGTYGCGNFADSKFLSIPDLPCTVIAPPTGKTVNRDANLKPVSQVKVLPTILKKGEPLQVELANNVFDLSIIGIDGKIYQTIKNASGSTQIQTSELIPGYYQIQMQNGQNLETERFIIVD